MTHIYTVCLRHPCYPSRKFMSALQSESLLHVGSKHVLRFRSANELMPHALWLLNTTTLNPKDSPPDGCQCKYCTKKRQSDVNEELRLPKSKEPKSLSQPRYPVFRLPKQKPKPGRSSLSEMHEGNGYWPSSNAARSTVIEGHHTLRAETRPKGPVTPLRMPNTLPPNMHPDRAEDLRLAHQSRDNELVWVPVHPPIPTPDNSCSIRHWPGMVVRWKRQAHVIPIPGGDESAYEVEESLWYTISLLATDGKERNYDSGVTLPFLAYRVEDKLLEALKHVPSPSMEMLGSQSQYFEKHSPFPLADNNQNSEHGAKELRFEDVAHQYSLALQIQANIAQFWSPLNPVGEALAVTQVQKSLSATKASGVTQYEGIWWGPEKIWCGELVRVICSHEDLAQHVNVRDDLRPRTFDVNDENEIASRGVLMHLREVFEDTILLSNRRGEDFGLDSDVNGRSTIKVCRVAGTLYETLKTGKDDDPHPNPSAGPTLVLGTPPLQIPASRQKPYLPPPPPFHRWHPIFHDGREIILDAIAIAGRYYPELLSNRHIPIEEYAGEADKQRAKELLSLGGLYKGQEVAIQPTLLVRNRKDAAREGGEEAMSQLFEWWRERHLGNNP
jgi:hypothetical protein